MFENYVKNVIENGETRKKNSSVNNLFHYNVLIRFPSVASHASTVAWSVPFDNGKYYSTREIFFI